MAPRPRSTLGACAAAPHARQSSPPPPPFLFFSLVTTVIDMVGVAAASPPLGSLLTWRDRKVHFSVLLAWVSHNWASLFLSAGCAASSNPPATPQGSAPTPWLKDEGEAHLRPQQGPAAPGAGMGKRVPLMPVLPDLGDHLCVEGPGHPPLIGVQAPGGPMVGLPDPGGPLGGFCSGEP